MQGNRRIVAIAISVAMIVTLLFFSAFLMIEASHNHQGEACSVCLIIEKSQNALKLLVLAKVLTDIAFFYFKGTLCAILPLFIDVWFKTLVRLKVKLVI